MRRIVLLALCACASAQAQVSKCTQADGTVKYTDQPCAAGEVDKGAVEVAGGPERLVPIAFSCTLHGTGTPFVEPTKFAGEPQRRAYERLLTAQQINRRRGDPMADSASPDRGDQAYADARGNLHVCRRAEYFAHSGDASYGVVQEILIDSLGKTWVSPRRQEIDLGDAGVQRGLRCSAVIERCMAQARGTGFALLDPAAQADVSAFMGRDPGKGYAACVASVPKCGALPARVEESPCCVEACVGRGANDPACAG